MELIIEKEGKKMVDKERVKKRKRKDMREELKKILKKEKGKLGVYMFEKNRRWKKGREWEENKEVELNDIELGKIVRLRN